MAAKALLPRDRLCQLLHYDPATGDFTWLSRNSSGWDARFAGTTAGVVDKYRRISIDHINYKAHRLAWLYVYGEPVPYEIDHIDTNKLNNQISNLRPATRSQTLANIGLRKDSKTGFKGVSTTTSGRFRAYIYYEGTSYWLGTFDTPHEAAMARREAAERLHGEFARHS